MSKNCALIGVLAAHLVAVGCGSDPASQPMAEDSGDSGADEQCDPGTETLAVGPTTGLQVMDMKDGIAARILTADYIPPAVDYNNWTIGVTDLNGSPMPNAKILWSCQWMPAHMHGTNPGSIKPLDDGQFAVSKINLAMYGNWESRFWVSTDPAAKQYAPHVVLSSTNGAACDPPA